jgi:flagellar hook-associated protein 2
MNDGSDSPFRLTLRSTDTGEDAAIASVDFGALASSLSLDAATEVTARNATFTANGVDIVSQSNQVEGAIENVTLSLSEVGEATVSVATDTDQITDKISGFVDAYNSLQETVGKLTAFDQETGEAGDLLGDATMRSARSRLRSVFVDGVTNGSITRLSDIGISLQLDGTLEIDSDALDSVLANDREALEGFFAGNDEGEGLADKLSTTLDGILSGTGLLENATNGLERRIESLDSTFDRAQLSIERTLERYREQFTQLDIMVANMNQTSGYIAQQFDILNAQLSQSR